MTHGDKAKAKTGKSTSQTSAKKVSKAVEAKAGGKEKSGKGGQAAGKKQQAGGEKTVAALKKGSSAGAKDSAASNGADTKGKAHSEGGSGTGFSNAAVASAFKHALKKYPNAFRRLTD